MVRNSQPSTLNSQPAWLSLLWLALAFAVLAPAFRHPQAFAYSYDWRLFQAWLEAGRRSVVWYGQFPLWNPWTCGGQVYLANPQSLVFTPTFPLVLIFGTALGIKLTLVAYTFCAFDGSYRLGRSYGLSHPAAMLAAILVGTGGWFALHYAEGHATFLGAALFPYAMLCYRHAVAVPGKTAWEWTLPLGAIAAGAARVLPALEFALDHPRHLFETDANSLWRMAANAYIWKGIEPVAGKRYWFHEYGWRLPYVTIPLWLWAVRVRRA